MPTTQGQGEPFVTRFEMAIMQYVILSKAKQGEVTKDNLKQVFRGNLQMSKDHLDHCLQLLVQDGHLRETGGNKYTATDDGREDVQKLQNLVIELPAVVNGGTGGQAQQQRPGMQQTTTGGSSPQGGTNPGTPQGGRPPNR